MDIYEHPAGRLERSQKFSVTEVGLKHPTTGSFIRFCDDGSIEIILGDKGETGIILSKDGVTIFGDKINLVSNKNGLRWNGKSFNIHADRVDEPALVNRPLNYRNPMRGLDAYGGEQ